jgi:hypothetical protein
MTDDSDVPVANDVPVTNEVPKGPPADKSWLEVENVRGGENPIQARTGPGER